jgi:hypothetical protein
VGTQEILFPCCPIRKKKSFGGWLEACGIFSSLTARGHYWENKSPKTIFSFGFSLTGGKISVSPFLFLLSLD